MRTTLTLDDDVAAQIEQLRRDDALGLKQVVNDALRRGLQQMSTEPRPGRKPYRTRTFNLGAPKFPIDSVADALAFAEGEDHR
jgi:hypothetical protein